MVTSINGATTNSAMTNSRSTIADNFDTFLNILTTQLRNQNPLDPLDTNQFTAQLVQFTGVEQQLKTNEFLETLIQSTQNSVKSDAVSYIGKQVTATGKTSELKDGEALWGYNADSYVASAIVNIKNAAGSVVYSESGSLNSGPGAFLWDGKGSNGATQPDGVYTIEILGVDLDGRTVNVSTSASGLVTAVDFSGPETMLTVGNNVVALKDVTSVRVPAAT